MLIARVLSEKARTDADGNILVYEIRRAGKRVDQGGKGVVWSCTCKSFEFARIDPKTGLKVPCKHLRCLYQAGRKKVVPYNVVMTKDGVRILKLTEIVLKTKD